jgi:hypothetical protein
MAGQDQFGRVAKIKADAHDRLDAVLKNEACRFLHP